MKTKVRTKVLVSLFIGFVIMCFIVFAIQQNNVVPISANIFLLLTLILGVIIFIIAIQLLSQLKKQIADAETSLSQSETKNPEVIEIVEEKIAEIEIDFKKIIPKEKAKLELFSEELLRNLAGELQIVQALMYIKNANDDTFKCTGKFAYFSETNPVDFKSGETLPGQAVKNKSIVTLSNIPENYMIVASGLGNGTPGFLTYIPIIFHNEVIGLVEFATFSPITGPVIKHLTQLFEKVAESISKFIK